MRKQPTDHGTYVYPTNVDFSRFDRSLFNIEQLLEYNYTEPQKLPLIITESPTRRQATNLLETSSKSNRPGVSSSFIQSVTTNAPLQANNVLGSIGGFSATIKSNQPGSAFETLRAAPNIDHVYLDKPVQITLDDAESVVNAKQARTKYNVSGHGVTVAVLDTGVDDTHPDLNGSIVLEKDFTGEGTVEDSHGHGTHVAGIITGDGTASNGTYVGIAPNASVMNLRVLDSSGYGSSSDIIDAMEFADANGAEIISMSLGGSTSSNDPFFSAVNTVVDNGTAVVVAAGNDGDDYETVKSPGVVPSAITVGASDDSDAMAWFSSRGPTPLRHYVKPDLVAPGVSIVSAKAGSSDYTSKSGTSMATPVVSGAAALTVDRYGDLGPTALKSLLVTTTDSIGSHDVYTAGSGRLNTTAALSADLIIDEPTIDFQNISSGETARSSFTITNIGSSTRTLDLSTSARTLEGAAGNVSLNRTTVTVDPGETVGISLVVAADTTMGVYSGHIQVNNGKYTTNYGYQVDAAYTLTVDKTAISDTDVSGDPVFLHDHTRDGASTSSSISATTTDGSEGTASFGVLEGNYTVYSAGIDESTGRIVMMARHLTITESTTVSFDESNTVVYELDTSGLEAEYGDLKTLRVHARISSVDGTHSYYQGWRTFHGTPDVRFSEGDFNATVTHLLAPSADYPNNERHLDTPVAFHLMHQEHGVQGSETYSPTTSDLAKQNIMYYRTESSQTYDVERIADNRRLLHPMSTGEWTIRDRTTQTIFTSPNGTQAAPEYELISEASGDEWTYHPGATVSTAAGQSVDIDVNRQPLTGTANFDFGKYASKDNVSMLVRPQVEQGNVRDTLKTTDASTEYTITRDGSVVADGTTNARNVSYYSDRSLTDGTTYEIVTVADNGARPLSTKTRTAVQATYSQNGDTSPPSVTDISASSLSTTNSLPNGTVTLNLTIADNDLGNETVLVRYADATVTAAPYSDSITKTNSGWTEAPVDEVAGESGTYQATINTDLGTDTFHLEVAVIDEAGNTISTAAYDAFAVDSRSGSEVAVNGSFELANGSAAASDTLTFVQSGAIDTRTLTDTTGEFDVALGDKTTYELTYRQEDTTSESELRYPTDGSPDIYAVGTVTIDGPTDLGTQTLPEGHHLNVSVVNESDAPVSDANVTIVNTRDGATASVNDTTNSHGLFEPSGSDGSGIEVTGNLTIEVHPPDEQRYLATTYTQSTTVTNPTTVTFVLDELDEPTATFTSNTTQAGIGEPIEFNASASHDDTGITAYEWNFDDGSSGTGEIINHSYSDPGSYQVSLTVTDEDGLQNTTTTTIDIADETPPQASLAANRTSIEVTEEAVKLDASASTDNYAIAEYRWDFTGDGSIDTTTNDPVVTTTYDQLGEQTVEVTVVDSTGNTDSASVTITVEDTTPPVASIDANTTSVSVDSTIQFDGTSSTDNHRIADYSWEFGDGETATGEAITHTYSNQGTYDVTLTVTDDSGNQDSATISIEVLDDTSPVANLTANRTTVEVNSESVEFDASGSSDNEEIVEYEWDLTGDDAIDQRTSQPTLVHSFETLGERQISVTVVDSTGNTDTASLTITVEDTTPPNAHYDTNASTVELGTPVEFDASTSTDNHEIEKYEWAFGDGSATTGTAVSHTFAEAGTYSVTLTVTDQSGNKETTTQSITVEKAASDGDGSDDTTDDGGDDGSDGGTSDSDDGTTGGSGGGQSGGGSGGAQGGGQSGSADSTDTGGNKTESETSALGVDITDTASGQRITVTNAPANNRIHVPLSETADAPFSVQDMGVTLTNPVDQFAIEFVSPSTSTQSAGSFKASPVIGYYQANRVNISNTDIEQVRFNLSLPERELPDGTSITDIALFRYHEGEWEQLQTVNKADGSIIATSPGLSTFAVAVDDEYTELNEPELVTRNISLEKTSIHAGETVTVRAIVENTGNQSGSVSVTAHVGTETLSTKTLSLAPGEAQSVEFETSIDSNGTYEVSVNGVSAGSVTVSESTDETTVKNTSEESDEQGASSATDSPTSANQNPEERESIIPAIPLDGIPPLRGSFLIFTIAVMLLFAGWWNRAPLPTWGEVPEKMRSLVGSEGSETSMSSDSTDSPTRTDSQTESRSRTDFEWVNPQNESSDD